MVDVAAHSPDYRAYRLKTFDNCDVSDVSGMPYFVTLRKMCGVTVVPAGMCVRENAYTFHFLSRYMSWSSIVLST